MDESVVHYGTVGSVCEDAWDVVQSGSTICNPFWLRYTGHGSPPTTGSVELS